MNQLMNYLGMPEYRRLFKYLDKQVFVIKHPLDKNRAQDALLRRDELGYVRKGPVTFLEILASLKWRVELELEDDVDIIRIIMNNSGLDKYTDDAWTESSEFEVAYICHKLINKTYDPDGKHGYVRIPGSKIRKGDIWRQVSMYLSMGR